MFGGLYTGRQRRSRTQKKKPTAAAEKIEYTEDGFVVTTLYIKSLAKEVSFFLLRINRTQTNVAISGET